jgi:hypothetical protein
MRGVNGMPRNRILIVFIPRWSVDSADSAAERNDVDTPTIIAVAHAILKRVPPSHRSAVPSLIGASLGTQMAADFVADCRRFKLIMIAALWLLLALHPLFFAHARFGTPDVWHSRCLALAFSGSRVRWQSRCLSTPRLIRGNLRSICDNQRFHCSIHREASRGALAFHRSAVPPFHRSRVMQSACCIVGSRASAPRPHTQRECRVDE